MPSDVAAVAVMLRAYPLRSTLLIALPIVVAAVQLHASLIGVHPILGVGFAAALLVYTAGVTRLHLARHRVERLDGHAEPHP